MEKILMKNQSKNNLCINCHNNIKILICYKYNKKIKCYCNSKYSSNKILIK